MFVNPTFMLLLLLLCCTVPAFDQAAGLIRQDFLTHALDNFMRQLLPLGGGITTIYN